MRTSIPCLSVAIALCAATEIASAHGFSIGHISVSDAYVLAEPQSTTSRPAYITLTNASGEPDRLLAIETPIAGGIDFQESYDEDGIFVRWRIEHLVIPAGGRLRIDDSNEGWNAILRDLRRVLTPGEFIDARFVFERAGTIDMHFDVQ